MAFSLKAKGLGTFGNELVKTEGTLDVALNIVIDEDDTIQPRRGVKVYSDAFGISTDRVKQIIEYKTRLIAHYTDKLALDNGSGLYTDFANTFNELENGLRIKYIEANSNLYLTTNT